MINTYRYGDHKNLHEDNTTQKLEVSPGKILEIKGPFIQVTITHPVEETEETGSGDLLDRTTADEETSPLYLFTNQVIFQMKVL